MYNIVHLLNNNFKVAIEPQELDSEINCIFKSLDDILIFYNINSAFWFENMILD